MTKKEYDAIGEYAIVKRFRLKLADVTTKTIYFQDKSGGEVKRSLKEIVDWHEADKASKKKSAKQPS